MGACVGSNTRRTRYLMQLPKLRTHWARNMIGGGTLAPISASALLLHLRATVGYNYEEHYLYMQSCCGGAIWNDSDKWSSQIVQRYNTVVASALWNAIPGKLDILADYVFALGTEANNSNGCSSNRTTVRANSIRPIPPWYGQPSRTPSSALTSSQNTMSILAS